MPEERNRIAVDRISQLLLCPDERSARQLESEGVAGRAARRRRRDGRRVPTLRADRALAVAGARAARRSSRAGTCSSRCTARRTSHPNGCARIVEGLNRLDEPIVFPVHPRTRAALADVGTLGFEPIAAARATSISRRSPRQRAGDRHRLRRGAEGGLLGRRALRDHAAEHRVGRHRRGRRERPRRRRPRRNRARGARLRASPATRRELYGDGQASGRIAAALYASSP